jgi:NAD(P)-dependent dehydrogenase (short-subunit alcohol dehydrogenase family)
VKVAVAIITGSDSGIGRATAVALAQRGFDVGITWHEDEEGARGTADEVRGHGRRAGVRRLDLSDPRNGAKVVDELADELGGVDVLVNNSGTGTQTPVLEMELDQWQRVLDVDLTGAFVAGQAAARRMVRQGRGGRIVNVTSVHEHIPLPGSAPYSASKGGLGMLTKVMALELAGEGITVNSVAPGEIATPMTGGEDVDPHTEERPAIPAGRPGDAREVAALIAHLCTPEAAYITGSSLVIDGGLMLMAAQQEREAP